MSQSPAKRRKLSPEPQLNATPTADRYPSFASPTRSSIARVAPQLLRRRSMENDAPPPQRTGALARTPPGAQPNLFVTQSSQGASQEQSPSRPLRRSPRSGGLRGGMASAPRRQSRSPQKAPPTLRAPDIFDEPPPEPVAPFEPGLANPFQKRPALRRSPPPGAVPVVAQEVLALAPEAQIDPFKRGGLRRSGGPEREPTPTQPTRPEASVVDSPLFVSQTTNSPLPNIDSSNISTHRPTSAPLARILASPLPNIDSSIISAHKPIPAPLARISAAVEKQRGQPEGSRPHVSQAEQEEPTLPPTPTQRGIADPVVTTPPTGIHNTPSKRLKRRTVHQSSPLKPNTARRSEPLDEIEREAETELEPANKRKRAAERSSRFSQPVDHDAEKKKRRERMLAEVRQLESDIRLAERENERVRKATAGGKDPKRPANAEALVELLTRTMAKPPSFEEPRKQAMSVLDNVGLFLPFSRPPKQKTRTTEEILKTEDLPSVLPVDVENPLPFLSVFTPFKFHSSISTLPPTPGHGTGEADIMQQHSITTSAPHCLFSSKVGVTVNTRSGQVESCEVEYLDSAADRELGPWIRKRARGGVLGGDVNSLFWASQQWYESALRRAAFWCQIESELSTSEGRERARRRMKAEARRGRRLQPGAPQEVEEHFEDEERKWSPEQLRRHMGRQSMRLAIDGATLIMHWRIDFDWTGEAQQAITAAVDTPRRWHEKDERKQLDRVPEIFAGLVKERSVGVAARTCVVLLMAE